jgi:hypothetical protein
MSGKDEIYKYKRFVAIVLITIFGLAIINLPSSNKTETTTSGISSQPEETFESKGCLKVSTRLIDGIATGLLDSNPTGIAAGFVSTDFEDVKMVAIEFIPNGLSDTEIAVFATSDSNLNDESVDGLIIPADAFAKNFSDWGVNPNLNLSTATAGVSEAKECLDFLK